MSLQIVRAAMPVMTRAAHATGSALRAGAKDGVQGMAAAAVIYGSLAIIGLGTYMAYQAGRTALEVSSRSTSIAMERARALFNANAKMAPATVLPRDGSI